MIGVSFQRRDSVSEMTALPSVVYTVDRYSHAAVGGPKAATIRATGDDLDLWELIERIRCPITLTAPEGDAVWWGYVAEVRANLRADIALRDERYARYRAQIGVSIDSMYNNIAVAYTKVDLTTGEEERDTTDWASNTLSIAEYGTRELLWSADAATETHAEAARDMKLEQVKFPVPAITLEQGDAESSATLVCRGWWDTLGWQYYANAGTATVDTAEQVYDILTAKGQFFETIWQDVDSGVDIRENRDGDATALHFAAKLLEMGTTNYRRLLVAVDPYRNVRIYEEPAKPVLPYQMSFDGSLIEPAGGLIRNNTCPVAVWAKLKDVIPASVDTSIMADPSLMFIEEMEYVVADDRLIPTPRGYLDPWDFPIVKDG